MMNFLRNLFRKRGPGSYRDKDLVYAAYMRCHCNAGIAYARGIGIDGWWDCSAILKGTASTAVKHTAKLYFTFYTIKSELQSSVRGATTRPVGKKERDEKS